MILDDSDEWEEKMLMVFPSDDSGSGLDVLAALIQSLEYA